ncbi:MAG: response regulator transcription factor [Ignavibacteria bacterium]|jgi:two-component system alkaline phosphatase synthesis response regulator PhoP|nr:response regulator transcription factor [Ignavibacteria bacterium]MCU7504213.1 response regulator transcription factor [Ignavibacteria bacterium]MCU7516058.1 response regulator transcription factor [Ignavibacteria bacterium]
MKSKILLVDDEKDIIELLQYNIEQVGYEVISANNGLEAMEKILEMPDLIILDVMMPVMDGYEVCRKIRQSKLTLHIPVILLTAKSAESDEVKGLELGADDFITKPISPKKLIARIRANLRRKDNAQDDENKGKTTIILGPLEIDREKFEAKVDGVNIHFLKKEFEILTYIALKPGRVMNRESILNEIWGEDSYITERAIDVHIRKIREKLGKHSDLIETIKGVGYRIRDTENAPGVHS